MLKGSVLIRPRRFSLNVKILQIVLNIASAFYFITTDFRTGVHSSEWQSIKKSRKLLHKPFTVV